MFMFKSWLLLISDILNERFTLQMISVSLSVFSCVETDCGKHLWASGHFLCWCPCNLPHQWSAPSGGENCYRQKGTRYNRTCKKLSLILCLSCTSWNPTLLQFSKWPQSHFLFFTFNKITDPRIKSKLNWSYVSIVRHTSLSHQPWSSRGSVQVVMEHSLTEILSSSMTWTEQRASGTFRSAVTKYCIQYLLNAHLNLHM